MGKRSHLRPSAPQSILNYLSLKIKMVLDFYQIMFKKGDCGTLQYGRNSYDYEDGTLIFIGPGQSITVTPPNEETEVTHAGWSLVFHSDLIRK